MWGGRPRPPKSYPRASLLHFGDSRTLLGSFNLVGAPPFSINRLISALACIHFFLTKIAVEFHKDVRHVKQPVTSEKLAYWYFRLNGFMTMENFILHSDSRTRPSQRTDADIYGVRFPFRREMSMPDDCCFQNKNRKPLFIIAEVKEGECKLNGPWTDPAKRNMQYVLQAIGAFEPPVLERIAESLYETYVYEDQSGRIQLMAIGSRENDEYKRDRPN